MIQKQREEEEEEEEEEKKKKKKKKKKKGGEYRPETQRLGNTANNMKKAIISTRENRIQKKRWKGADQNGWSGSYSIMLFSPQAPNAAAF